MHSASDWVAEPVEIWAKTCTFLEHFLFVKLYPTLFGDSLGDPSDTNDAGYTGIEQGYKQGGKLIHMGGERDAALVERLKELSFLRPQVCACVCKGVCIGEYVYICVSVYVSMCMYMQPWL